jgi:hypothetical protein
MIRDSVAVGVGCWHLSIFVARIASPDKSWRFRIVGVFLFCLIANCHHCQLPSCACEAGRSIINLLLLFTDTDQNQSTIIISSHQSSIKLIHQSSSLSISNYSAMDSNNQSQQPQQQPTSSQQQPQRLPPSPMKSSPRRISNLSPGSGGGGRNYTSSSAAVRQELELDLNTSTAIASAKAPSKWSHSGFRSTGLKLFLILFYCYDMK